MKLFYTNLKNSNNLFTYLFDFKCNDIHSIDVEYSNLVHTVAPNFEHIFTMKMNDEWFVKDTNNIMVISNQEMNRGFCVNVEDGAITRLYLNQKQLDVLDELIEIEHEKELGLFEAIVNSLEIDILKTFGYDKSKHIISVYSENDYDVLGLQEELENFLGSDYTQMALSQIKGIEDIMYNNFDFDDVVQEKIKVAEMSETEMQEI
ncbi:hypothetical protein [Breznakia pachnodae]|uniref:Uncharacterized protein n=1 Tax=Breznakia pachnodae TaxID=265178 RepID=A0ABU0E3U6_9FIRM|nr:hypothetical protein [Breznakia pachnodae]MDQ0361573.1 hypothetical protein [Breznakia pachnodae]